MASEVGLAPKNLHFTWVVKQGERERRKGTYLGSKNPVKCIQAPEKMTEILDLSLKTAIKGGRPEKFKFLRRIGRIKKSLARL
jgi:hypothetical protein